MDAKMSSVQLVTSAEQKIFKSPFDFSIENLLRKESTESLKEDGDIGDKDLQCNTLLTMEEDPFEQLSPVSTEENKDLTTFHWLNCTRFKPPKLPRSSRKRVGCKRYGRGPRIPFAPHQIAVLESTFAGSQYLSGASISAIADALNLSETRNRRARFRRERETPLVTRKSLANSKPAPALSSGKTVFAPSSAPSRNNKSAPQTHLHNVSVSSISNSHHHGAKRKLIIPHFLSRQIQNQCHEQMLSRSAINFSSSANNYKNNDDFNSNNSSVEGNVETMRMHSFPASYLSALSASELSLSYGNGNATAHFSRILCGASSSAFAPVQFPIQHL